MKKKYQDFSELYKRHRFGIRPGLEGMRTLLERLGNPEKEIPVIHIAGSNGKGSVASLMASILQAAGFRVGLYTSPHLLHFRERFRINGKNPDDTQLASLAREIESIENPENPATFFEMTTAMAFLLFHRKKTDFTIMETGMGGRWDATNVACSELSVITTLSLEHTEILGNTLEAVAREKAGIVKEGIPLITGVRAPKALDLVREQAKRCRAPLKILDEDFFLKEEKDGFFTYEGEQTFRKLKPGLLGAHQAMNMALALAGLESLCGKRKNLTLSEDWIREGIRCQNWPARMQLLHQEPTVLLDGAHNEAGAGALADFIRTRAEEPKFLVFGVLSDKNASAMLNLLSPLFSEIVFTRPESPRSRDPETLPSLLSEKRGSRVLKNPDDALSCALKKCPKKGLICIAGSLFLAGAALNFFERKASERKT